jgi:hypothetical protein
MIASTLARKLRRCAALAALGLLALAGTSYGQAETGSFQAQNTFTDTEDDTATCLGPGASGTITATETVAGRFTENGPPTFGFHVHWTSTLDYRIDYVDGRYVLGTAVGHFDENAAGPAGRLRAFTTTEATQDYGTLYGSDGQPLGRVTIHAIFHLTYRDTNGNRTPDPGEITASVDRSRVTCS